VNQTERYRLFTVIIIIFIILILITYLFYRNYSYYPHGGSELEGIEIYRSEYHSFGTYLNPIELGLDNDSIENVTNGTLKLEITVSYSNYTHNVTYHWSEYYTSFGRRVIRVENQHDGIQINDPICDYRYNFTLRYILNSNDPDIRDQNLMGENNTVSGTFSIASNWTMDYQFNQNYDNVTIIDGQRFRIPLRQVIMIRSRIVVD
jgi:hypothetical protein